MELKVNTIVHLYVINSRKIQIVVCVCPREGLVPELLRKLKVHFFGSKFNTLIIVQMTCSTVINSSVVSGVWGSCSISTVKSVQQVSG